jgi:hypothetical protein
MDFALKIVDFVQPTRWRWVLTDDATGALLADQEVDLDQTTEEFGAFSDLHRYLRWNAIPDRRTANDLQ